MGKREIGKLSVFDFVVSVMIAELSTTPMEDTKIPMYHAFVSVASLVLLQLIVAYVSLKSHRFRHMVEGEPTVLIEHGEIKDQAMRRIRYSMHDLLMQLREKGYANVADVEFAILETSGQLSAFPRSEGRPITAEDLGMPVQPIKVPMPLIVDGQPNDKTLKTLGRDREWLRDMVKRRGYGSIEDVFYASVDDNGRVQFDARDDQ